MLFFRRIVFSIALLFLLPQVYALADSPTADELCDVAAPEGVSDEDVDRIFMLISGEEGATLDDILRGDVSPAELLSGQPGVYPHHVRPNPNPDGSFDVGDAVLAARRAAGDIVFDGLNAPPTVVLYGDGTLTKDAMWTLTGTVSDDQEPGDGSVEIRIGDILVEPEVDIDPGGDFSIVVELAEDQNEIKARATDVFGRTGDFSAPIFVTLDSYPPTVVIEEPEQGDYIGESPFRFSGSATDPYGVVEVLVDGSAAQLIDMGEGQWLWGGDVSFASDGEWTIGVSARDTAGNLSAPVTVTVTFDDSPPEISFDPVVSPTNQHTVELTGSIADEFGISEVTVNGDDAEFDFSAGTWGIEVDIYEGDNTFTARAVDLAGNYAEAGPVVIEGDFIPPVLTLLSDSFVNYSPYDWIIGISEPVTIQSVNGDPDGARYDGDSFTIANYPIADGENSIEIVVIDDAGNSITETLTVTMDSTAPYIEITEVFKEGAVFIPEGGVDGVFTNASTVFIGGIVYDETCDIELVMVNGYEATVTDDTFLIGPLSLNPRANEISAVATDEAGNEGGHTITVHQDLEGPVIELTDFARGAHVSSTGQFNDPGNGNYDGSTDITVSGSASDVYTGIQSITASWREQSLQVESVNNFADFNFTIPAAAMADGGLHLLTLKAADEFNNVNTDNLSALTGQFALRGTVVKNGAGLGLGAESLSFFSGMIEQEIEAMDGTELLDQEITQSGFTLHITGMAFCDPGSGHRHDPPTHPMDPPDCRYGCTQDVDVTMGIDGDGHVDIVINIPYLYVDFSVPGQLMCWFGGEGYIKSSPAVISLKADFVDGENGPELRAVSDSVTVSIQGFDIDMNGCTIAGWILSLFKDSIRVAMEDAFKAQIDTILGSLGDSLAVPIMANENTDFELYFASISNSTLGLVFWMDFHGNPCPDSAHLTDKMDSSTPEEDDYIPCLDPAENPGALDIYGSPGSYATPNPDGASRPALTLLDQDSNLHTLQAVINDDLVNYLLYSEWAQGTLELTIDQEMVGDALTLDTQAFSIFVPELADPARADVQEIAPAGTPMVILAHPMLPLTVKSWRRPENAGRAEGDVSGIQARAGDMILSFLGDVDIDGVFETPLFDISITLYADAGLEYHRGETDLSVDYISIDLADPVVYSDLVWSAFIINEATLNASIPTLIELVLPMMTESFGQLSLPGNGIRITEINVIDPNEEFINLVGDLQATIAITAPSDKITGNLPFEGKVTGLRLDGGGNPDYTFEAWLGPATGDESDLVRLEDPFFLFDDEVEAVFWYGEIDETDLTDGENELKIIVFDNNFPDENGEARMSYHTMIIGYDAATGESTVVSGGSDGGGNDLFAGLGDLDACLGCRSQGEDMPVLLIFVILFGLAIWHRRRLFSKRPKFPTLLLLILSTVLVISCNDSSVAGLGGSGGGGNGGDSDSETDGDGPPNHFTGPDVDDNPVVLLNMIQIGEENQGFNLDEGRSPEGDPEPDNGIAVLGGIANENLSDALEKGQVLLLLQFAGMNALPAAGESGEVEIKGYLGLDMDEDPSNNFDGSQTFGIDPASFDGNGDLLIHFTGVTIFADETGEVHMEGGPAMFTLSIPLGDDGSAISLTISETQVEAVLQPSSLRQGGIDLKDGLLGGVIPCSVLAEPIEALGDIAPLSLLKMYVDIDLNENGELDKRNDPGNEDGISAGVIISGVPAFIDESTKNLAPTIVLDAMPETVTEAILPVTGSITDPDGNCMNATVSVRAGDGDGVPAVIEIAETGCGFAGEIVLAIGENTVIATVTDELGAKVSDSGSTTLIDEVPPTIYITGPEGPQVTAAVQTLTGFATDNVGVMGVQIVIEDGQTHAILGGDLGENGEFSIGIDLPKLGWNRITATAKDLADNISEEAEHLLELVDADPPVLTLIEVSDGVTTVGPPDDLVVHKPDISVLGNVTDNFGEGELVIEAEIGDSRERLPCEYDALAGSFSVELTISLGDNLLTFYATDPSDNVASSAHTVSFLDNAAPVIQVTSPPPLVDAADQLLRFRVEDDVDAAASLEPVVIFNGQSAVQANYDQTEDDFYLEILLSLGENQIRIEVSDLSGNLGESEGVIELEDNTPPSLEITEPGDGFIATEAAIAVSGFASDDIGLAAPPLVITLGDDSYEPTLGVDGAFSQSVELAMGENLITVAAFDGSGLSTVVELRGTRRDPNAPSMLRLSADPASILVDGGRSRLTAAVECYAGGPVPMGTLVAFTAEPDDLGQLSDSFGATIDDSGDVSVTFTSFAATGSVRITATAGEGSDAGPVSDSATIIISEPTVAVLEICSDGSTAFAGVDLTLNYSGDAVTENPLADSLTPIGSVADFHTHNTRSRPPRLLWAGTRLIGMATTIGEFSWPLGGGAPDLMDFSIDDATVSDLLGVTDDSDGFAVCGLENQMGDLPPIVDLDPLPQEVEEAEQTIAGTVSDDNLETCEGILSVNGSDESIDVSSGSVSVDIVLVSGDNTIILEVTDENSNIGRDTITVRYAPPNDPPVIAVTSLGASTSLAQVTVEGTITDDGPLSEAAVRARAGNGNWVYCTVDGDAGTWASDEPLSLVMGGNTIRVEAEDGLGGTASIMHNVRRVEPIMPPEITMTEPDEGQDFSQNPVSVTGDIAEGGNPAQIAVTMKLNDEPHDIYWDYFNRSFSASVNLIDGENTLIVRAEDMTGGFDEVTRHVSFTAPDDPPTVTITAPENGASLAAGEILVEGTIIDDRPLYTLQSFKVNATDVILDNADGQSSTWSAMVPLVEGENILAAEANDMRGNTGGDSVTVNNVAPPTIVMNVIRIGGGGEGFNVDQVGMLGDLGPDNALTGLGSLANPLLADKLVDPEKPMLLIFEFTGMAALPGPGDPPVDVDIIGYIGLDLDGDSSDNFSGTETFGINPDSYDPDTGQPLIKFEDVQVYNDYGVVRINTYPDQPSFFSLEIDNAGTALVIDVEPAFLDAVLIDTANGVGMDESLLGGVVPAGNLAIELDMEGQIINPLEILIRDDPSNPIPDVDLNEDGVLATNPETDATPENPDGVSVGIITEGVPCSLQR